MKDDTYVGIDYDSIEYETDRAMLFIIEDDKVWVPKSCIHHDDMSGIADGEPPEIVRIMEWFALEHGLI